MIATLLAAAATVVLPQVPGVYQGPGCAGHPERPPASYTSRLKRAQIAHLGYADTNPRHYQEDHLVSLSIGGNLTSPLNPWPQPIRQAKRDDRIEFELYERACLHRGRPLTVRAAVGYERA